MNEKYISTQRTNIMGLAIILIIIFHTDILYSYTLDKFKNFCDFGVNIFYAVSGFSMCFAWNKQPDAVSFYKNRFLRIGITVLPISISWNLISFLIHEVSGLEAILKILTIQFWIDGNLLQWFISGLIVFYLITPFWMHIYNNRPKLCLVLTIVLCTVCFIQPFFYYLPHIIIFIQRVPSYFIGLYLGKHVTNHKTHKNYINYLVYILLIISIIGFALIGFNTQNYTWKYTMFTLLTFPLLMIVSYLLECHHSSIGKVLLTFLGSITLEIYLIQEKMLKVFHILLNKLNIHFDSKNIILNIIVVFFTILLGHYYNRICSAIYKKVRK